MKTVNKIEVPDAIYHFLACDNECDELRRNAMLLYPFIQNRTISHGRAAEILGISKMELIDLYGNEGFSYLDESDEELESDLNNINSVLSGV